MSSSKAQTSKSVSTSQQADSPSGSASASSIPCTQCKTSQAKFYCTSCLSERLIWQHANHRRLKEERLKARGRVEARLGSFQPSYGIIASKEVPNTPTEALEIMDTRKRQSNPTIASLHTGASYLDIAARATRARLKSDTEQHSAESQRRRKGALEKRRRIAERRQELARRRSLLETAQMSLYGLVETEEQERLCLSHESLDKLRQSIADLEEESNQVANDIAKARARLCREAYSLFDIRAPFSSLANIRANPDNARDSGRNTKSKERYTAGAFAIDFTNAFDLRKSFRDSRPKESAGNINDWTIMGLVLPVPSDVKRFEPNEVNGAISHIIQLLQLITAYLGITLPFVISIQAGLPYIRANQLWGAGAKESLHLSSPTYNSLTSASSAATMGGMGASMMSNLGASTLSTIESFVQLPSGKSSFPWVKNVADPVSKDAGDHQHNRTGEETKGDDAATLGGKRFYSALIMLSYDVAYLAHIQGMKVDLIMTAASCLRLLFKAIQSAELGKRSHSSHHAPSNISSLQFNSLDFAQLLQVHEPGFHGETTTSSSNKHPASRGIMEGSYVDAKTAAESILNLQKLDLPATSSSPSTARVRATKPSTPSPASLPKSENISSLAAKRVPSTLQPNPKEKKSSQVGKAATAAASSKASNTPSPNTLDFLRNPANREPKAASAFNRTQTEASRTSRLYQEGESRITASSPATGGTIIFNGKEIRGKARSSTSSRAEKAKGDEDGWHVL